MNSEWRGSFFPAWQIPKCFIWSGTWIRTKGQTQLTEMVRKAIYKAAMYKAQFRRVRSPGSPMFSSKCTIPTSLVQAISPLSFHTCYKFCAFFHPSGQVALLLDLGDNAFHNPPRQGVNCRSTWDTKQDSKVGQGQSSQFRTTYKDQVKTHWSEAERKKGALLNPIKHGGGTNNSSNTGLCPPLTSNPEGNDSEMITHFVKFPAATAAL